MSIEAGIYALAMSCAPLTAIIGTRLTPELVPEGSPLPAGRFLFAGGNSDPTFDTSGMQKVRVQFDFYADAENGTYDDAMNARDVWRKFLNGYQGMLSDGTYLDHAEWIQPIGVFQNDARQYRCGGEFYLWFNFAD